MAFPDLPRRAVWVLWAALAAPMPLAAQTPADAAAVRGLIVRLKDAPSHVELAARPQAGLREQPLATPARERELARRQRVLGEAGLDAAAGSALRNLRPVGRDQLLLTLTAPVTATQAQAIVDRLAARPEVDWVQVNTRERRLQLPDDGFFQSGAQWWLLPATGTDANALADRRRGVPGFQSAWLRPGGTGSPSAVIAVLDTGITPHPELEGRVLPGYDFVADLKFGADGDGRDANPNDPGDGVTLSDLSDPHFKGCTVSNSSWHGTVIAGLTAARTNDANGVAAIHWDGRILPVRVAGKCGADVADIVEGMRWAAGLPACRRDDGAGTCVEFAPVNANPARIVNISFGSSNACGAAYQTAVNELKAANAVVIAAAGNEHATPTRPANCTGAIGVAGLARDGYKTHYSNFGGALAATGIATVSGDDNGDPAARWNVLADEGILSIGNDNSGAPGYYYFWGTSFSAPLVSGAVSLMLSVNPSLSYAQIVDGLRRSARPHVTSSFIGPCSESNPGRCICTTATCGVGILDAEQAVLYAANPAAYVPPTWPQVRLDSTDIAAAAALGPDRVANVTPPPPSGGGGGGGAWSWPWLLALGLAAWALSARGAGSGRLRRR
jgi:serine protease